jgi:hypothetical protein
MTTQPTQPEPRTLTRAEKAALDADLATVELRLEAAIEVAEGRPEPAPRPERDGRLPLDGILRW